MTDDPSAAQSSTGTVSRRTYTRLLGALGVGGSLTAAQSMRSNGDDIAAAAQNRRPERRGITVSDSGSTVDDDVTHLDFGGALTAVGSDDSGDEADSVRIQAADDSSNANIVNVRDDLGVEPQQGDVWGAIYDHYQSFSPTNRNHRYVLPAGTWHVETDNIHLNAHEYFGLVGEPFATLKVTSQDVDRMMTVGRIDDSLPHAQRTVMKDLQVDIRGEYDAGICRWYTYSYGLIENVSMRGRRDRLNPTYGGDRHTIMVDGRQTTTTNIIRGCHLNNGDTSYNQDTHVGHAIPFSSEIYNLGTNIWEACQVTGYIDNGFYVSNNSGRNIITGCHARNCAGAGIRIGANDYVRNCRITMTEQPGYPWSGLWLENGGGQIVDGLTVHNSIEKNTEIVRLTQDGPARLVGVHITDDGGNGRAIRVADNDRTRTVFHSCSITDRTSPTVSDYAVYVRSSNVVFKDCEYDLESQSEQDRHGFFVSRQGTNVDRLVLNGTDIDADGASLRFAESGRAHNVESTVFDGLVLSDSDTTLEEALWVGNRHEGDTAFRGERINWKGDFNFGFTV
ncbi:right-handed parallel beta-helix repeat-containing protein [Halosolutus gelatinilyticus]|uniref:right-handed parallel beta-helix repeat-containing protein n=1 Tax=Halosolutus gelatinilyticus TaxID=2931975 RepID=UPI001FF14B45|nr:right-handed parallel beta-helix repeat-containing protein [Halosolutus gelatinilyticus]